MNNAIFSIVNGKRLYNPLIGKKDDIVVYEDLNMVSIQRLSKDVEVGREGFYAYLHFDRVKVCIPSRKNMLGPWETRSQKMTRISPEELVSLAKKLLAMAMRYQNRMASIQKFVLGKSVLTPTDPLNKKSIDNLTVDELAHFTNWLLNQNEKFSSYLKDIRDVVQ